MYSVISVKLDSLPANTGARQAAALHRSLTRVSTDYSQPAVPWISTLFPLFPRSDVSSFWDRTLNGNRVRSLHKRENVKSDLRKRNKVVWSHIFGGRHPISGKMKMGGKADTIRVYCGPTSGAHGCPTQFSTTQFSKVSSSFKLHCVVTVELTFEKFY